LGHCANTCQSTGSTPLTDAGLEIVAYAGRKRSPESVVGHASSLAQRSDQGIRELGRLLPAGSDLIVAVITKSGKRSRPCMQD
jgi:hypothetical protein